MPKLNEPHRDHDIFDDLSFFNSFFDDILTLGYGSVDPYVFTDPDLGNQNVADPKDPDPKH